MYEEFLGKKDEGNIGRETADESLLTCRNYSMTISTMKKLEMRP